MKTFILKSFILIALTILPYLVIQYHRIPPTDSFYWKAASSADALILGGSRALKGLAPEVFEEEFGEMEMLNYAFTALHSPYGQPYFESVKKKLRDDHQKGIFILSVTPASIMDYADSPNPREDAFRFYDLWQVDGHPHIEYLLRNPRTRKAIAETLISDAKSPPKRNIIHPDGWEETPPSGKKTSNTPLPKKVNQPLNESTDREMYLKKTIHYLQTRGRVFLVRLPISQQMKAVEDNKMRPDFDAVIQSIAQASDIPYLNYVDSGGQYQFVNGHQHLAAKSARDFSRQLVRDIQKYNVAF